MTDVWTCDDVAAYLQLSRTDLDYYRKTADFPKFARLGGGKAHPRWRAQDIIDWLERQPNKSAKRTSGLRDRGTVLYRHFDRDGCLLYVGIAANVISRSLAHHSASHWFESVVRIEIQRFSCRQDAMEAEKAAIKAEHPLHNRLHSTQ